MRVLLTGAAGFLGYHVAEQLLARGDEVVGLDLFDDAYPVEAKQRNAADLGRWPGWWLVRGDVRDRELVRRLCATDGIEAIVHLAARCGLEEARREPERHVDVNVGGTAAMLEAAHRARVRTVVLGSSACVYGAEPPPQRTDSPWHRPISVHGATRCAAELLCSARALREGLKTTALRLFSVYGPRQRPDGAVQSFLTALQAGGRLRRHGDGSQVRDFVHVEDAARAFIAALDHSIERATGHRSFNIGTGVGTSLTALLSAVAATCGASPAIEEVRPPAGEAPALVADAEETRRELGWRALISLEEGLRSQLEWHRAATAAAAPAALPATQPDEDGT